MEKNIPHSGNTETITKLEDIIKGLQEGRLVVYDSTINSAYSAGYIQRDLQVRYYEARE